MLQVMSQPDHAQHSTKFGLFHLRTLYSPSSPGHSLKTTKYCTKVWMCSKYWRQLLNFVFAHCELTKLNVDFDASAQDGRMAEVLLVKSRDVAPHRGHHVAR